ncbi:MAG: orotidine-5'-phosphate decarboxylase [Patescibacteria group bacterium]|nr:orotidine-5'-phosphate decarboxylase [Patescibacteria group bacterium]MDE1944204.1 orotidine-5'-phosphate decarboxylase [Patescibacteria group bacterium]MDE1944919.1 orotidine-5'-phosphate decarboxylase [Patescibacteria group bacterium]MDE2057440.1 orotidine-5'-phosphate decarboxylase [Patescibacteria group bacterium]
MSKHFADRLAAACREKKSILCVGIDPQIELMPKCFTLKYAAQMSSGLAPMADRAVYRTMFEDFVSLLIDATEEFAAVVKPNLGFSLEYGGQSVEAYEFAGAQAQRRGLVVINDAKCDDGSDTAKAHARAHLGPANGLGRDGGIVPIRSPIQADAVTVEPRLGVNCLGPFANAAGDGTRGMFVFVRTSFTDPTVEDLKLESGDYVWQHFGRETAKLARAALVGNSGYCSVGAVVGANRAEDARWLRELLPNSIFLAPAIGKQLASYDDAVAAAGPDGLGVVANDGRRIMYAGTKNPDLTLEGWQDAMRAAAKASRDGLNEALARAGKSL